MADDETVAVGSEVPELEPAAPAVEKYVKVTLSEDGAGPDVVEVPAEEDGTLSLETLRSQFPAAAGLKYRNAETDSFRAMRVRDGRVPEPEGGWSDRVYVVVVAPPQEAAGGAKRSADEAGLNALPTAPSLLTGAPSQNRQLSEASHRLFIGNLPFTIRGEDHLKEFFPDATSISVPRHADTGKVKGFGYIVYPDVEQATAVLEKQNGLEIDGRQTYLDFAPMNTQRPNQKRMRSDRCKKLFIGNLPFTIKDATALETHFPTAASITLPTHSDTGKIKGFAYASFETIEAAEAALNEKEGLVIDDRSIRIDFAPERGPGVNFAGPRFNRGRGGGGYGGDYGHHGRGGGYGYGHGHRGGHGDYGRPPHMMGGGYGRGGGGGRGGYDGGRGYGGRGGYGGYGGPGGYDNGYGGHQGHGGGGGGGGGYGGGYGGPPPPSAVPPPQPYGGGYGAPPPQPAASPYGGYSAPAAPAAAAPPHPGYPAATPSPYGAAAQPYGAAGQAQTPAATAAAYAQQQQQQHAQWGATPAAAPQTPTQQPPYY